MPTTLRTLPAVLNLHGYTATPACAVGLIERDTSLIPPQAFLNLHGYTYLRLDGSTKPEERQVRLLPTLVIASDLF